MGNKSKNPRFLEKSEKKLIRLQKELSRKTIGSSNRNKARIKVAKQYEKITNQRKDFLHKTSTQLILDYDVICLESLNINNMIKNRRLSKSISNVSWGEFIKQLRYKATWNEKIVQQINQFFPSSQVCSCCGDKNVKVKDLSIRNWTCINCSTIP